MAGIVELPGGGYAQRVQIVDSEVQQPVEIQGHRTETIQTHNAVNIATTVWSGSAWFDTDGYSEVSLTMLNDASTNSQAALEWSNDGATKHGSETLLATNTLKERCATTSTKARYVKVAINNPDAASHIFSAWIYLKA